MKETHRIKKIVQNLLNFSKPKKEDFKFLDVNKLLKQSLRLVKNMLHISGIKSEIDLQENLPHIFADENKLQSVFVNIMTNAIQAMPNGGTLSVRTCYDERENPDYIIIEIEDTGKGIPREFLPNIFDPFFSTKGTKGTGPYSDEFGR